MEQIINNLYVGRDEDYDKLASREGWSFLRCCKEGPGGHREALGYATQGAPKGPTYLAVTKDHGHRMALNFIDPSDPHFIPKAMVEKGLEFIDARLGAGDKVLVACNAGHSRGPTTAMLYLRSIGELAGNFIASERIFRTLYHPYDPGIGARQFARSHWDEFNDSLRKAKGKSMSMYPEVEHSLGGNSKGGSKPKKEIHHVEVHKSDTKGDHIITHHHTHPDHHPAEKHTTRGDDEMAQHMMASMGTPNPGEAAPDPNAAAAPDPSAAGAAPAGAGAPMAAPMAGA